MPYAKIYKELDIFTEESFAMPKMNNPFFLEDESNHPMIFGYFMGVMDYIAQQYQLSEKDKRKIYTEYLLKNFADNNEKDAKELVKYSNNIRETDEGSHCALRGKLAMKKWVGGGPMAGYATMGLLRVLND